MSTTPIAYPINTGRELTRSPLTSLRILRKETKYEFLKLLRNKAFSLAVIGFPVMFYMLFGIANRGTNNGNVHMAKYLLCGYACFGLVGAALFGIGVSLANERAAGWLELKQASPMPPLAYLFAKCTAAAAFGLIIVALLSTLGITMGGVSLRGIEMAKMAGLTIVGAISFASMGLLLAQIVPANAAPAIVNLIYLPMSFLSGLWMPLKLLPHWVQRVGSILPTYHLSQLMFRIFGYGDGSSLSSHWIGLAGFTMLMVGLSWLVFNRTQQNA